MKSKYAYKRTKKRKRKSFPIAIFIAGILVVGLTIWVGMNNWNVEKSFEKLLGSQKGDETPETASPNVSEPEEEPSDVNKTPNEQDTSEEDKENEVKDEEKIEEESEKNKGNQTDSSENDGEDSDNVTNPTDSVNNGGYIEGQELPSEPTFVKNVLVANKKYPLPSTYAPGENTNARAAFNELAAEAALSGFNLTAFSTYRSFEYQTTLYEKYVTRDGREEADRYSARPGYSEHQTGLAFDIGEVNFEKHWARDSFGETEAGKWVAANAHRFGFILRYPEEKESITGYMHESWHFRYVGVELAKEIFTRNVTLEEYLEI